VRDSANLQVRMYSPIQDGRDSTSVYSTQGANNTPTVETVQEGGSEDSLEEY